MIKLSNKILNSSLPEKAPNTQVTNNSNLLISQSIPSNQNSLLTQNSSLGEIPKPKENEKKV